VGKIAERKAGTEFYFVFRFSQLSEIALESYKINVDEKLSFLKKAWHLLKG